MCVSEYHLGVSLIQKSLKDFLKPYVPGRLFGRNRACDWSSVSDPAVACFVGLAPIFYDPLSTSDYACSPAEDFGYPRGKPCVMIKASTYNEIWCSAAPSSQRQNHHQSLFSR